VKGRALSILLGLAASVVSVPVTYTGAKISSEYILSVGDDVKQLENLNLLLQAVVDDKKDKGALEKFARFNKKLFGDTWNYLTKENEVTLKLKIKTLETKMKSKEWTSFTLKWLLFSMYVLSIAGVAFKLSYSYKQKKILNDRLELVVTRLNQLIDKTNKSDTSGDIPTNMIAEAEGLKGELGDIVKGTKK
jgi:hypothetical protein